MELVPDSALVDRTVMVVWHAGTTPEELQPLVERLRERVGKKGRVTLENADRLESSEWREDTLHTAVSPSLSHHQFPMRSPQLK